MLKILVDRDQNRRQSELFDLPLQAELLEQKQPKSQLRESARLFLSAESEVPYYFGTKVLSELSSGSIDQFLLVGADLFEQVLSAAIMRKTPRLEPAVQHKIIKKTARDYWTSLRWSVRNGNQVLNLLEAIGMFSREVTFRGTASYAPGVTGIAIHMADCNKLKDAEARTRGEGLGDLAKAIASAVANNLLELHPNIKCKGRKWLVLYLNRLLCVYFGLPLQYGGWREIKLAQLVSWVQHGFRQDSRQRELIS